MFNYLLPKDELAADVSPKYLAQKTAVSRRKSSHLYAEKIYCIYHFTVLIYKTVFTGFRYE